MKRAETVFDALLIPTAKETRVGGTSSSLKEPLILSLPPMDGAPYPICAVIEPSRAAVGLPQRFGSSFSLSKYSWKVRRAFDGSHPAAASFASDSVTANAAEWNGLHSESFGIKPYAITVASSVSPLSTGSFAAITSSGVS